MRWCSSSVLLTGLAVLLFTIHDGSGQTDQTDRRLRSREKQRYRLAELSRSSTAFGVNLYRQLAYRDSKNVIFSPFSVFTALSMTLLGSEGNTKNELRSVLKQRPRQGIHQALKAVFASFPTSPEANVTLRVANAIYYDDEQVTLKQSFTANIRRLYGADPEAYTRPNPEVPINDWIYRQTGGKIEDFYKPGDISSEMVLLLLNAVYFQGTWKDIFRERNTRMGNFTTASGDVVRVPMMSRDGSYAVKYDVRGMRVLELPYGTDGRFSMFILLPEEVDGLSSIEARLNGQMLEDAVTNMPQASRYAIRIPKLKLRVKTSMTEMLQSMGLTRLFSNGAQLDRMSDYPLKVSDVKHEALIEVDERGTVAAAVTSVEIVLTSLPPGFVVDRPFLFVLRDNSARLNLFMGRVNDPSQSA